MSWEKVILRMLHVCEPRLRVLYPPSETPFMVGTLSLHSISPNCSLRCIPAWDCKATRRVSELWPRPPSTLRLIYKFVSSAVASPVVAVLTEWTVRSPREEVGTPLGKQGGKKRQGMAWHFVGIPPALFQISACSELYIGNGWQHLADCHGSDLIAVTLRWTLVSSHGDSALQPVSI